LGSRVAGKVSSDIDVREPGADRCLSTMPI